MRLVKIGAAVLGGMLVLALVGAVALAWLFDPNDYKQALTAEFERRTGRTLEIGRDLALEYLPWLAVETGGIAVGNAPGFSGRDFARVERVAARIELLPLVRGDLRVGTILLEGLELNLETDADGRGNWTLAGAADAQTAPEAGAGANRLETLDVAGLRVRSGTITWRDLATGRELALHDLSVTSGAYRAGEAVAVEAAFRLTDSSTRAVAAVEAQATVEYTGAGLVLRGWRSDLDAAVPGSFATRARAAFEAVEWRPGGGVTTTGAEVAGWLEAAALGGQRREVAAAWPLAEIDPAAGAFRLDNLTTSVDGIRLHWRLAGESLLEAGRIEGRVAVERAPLAAALQALSIALPEGVEAGQLGDFDVASRFTAALDPFAIELQDIEAHAFGAALTGSAAVSGEAPHVTAAVVVPAFAPSPALRALLATRVPEGIALEAFETLALAADVEAVPARGAVTLDDLRAELLGATLTGRADLTFADGDVTARGRVASTPIAPRAFDAAFGALVTDTVDRRELGRVAFDAGFDYSRMADRLALDPLAIEVFGLRATGTLAADALTTAPVYTGRASIEHIAPRELMRRFGQAPPNTSDPAALAAASIDTRFEVTRERGDFRELVLLLDQSRITGDFTVIDFENPAYRFALAVDRLDADRYMAPRADDAAPDERAAGDLELDGEALDLLDLRGSAEIGDLTIAGLEFEQVATRIELGRGVARLDDARALLYGGRFDGAFAIDSSGALPRMSLSGRAEGIDLAPLIADLTARDSTFSGRGDLDLELSGTGLTVTENVRSAAGTMGFALRDGAIEGFDLGRTLCAAYNATQRLPAPPEPDAARTRYVLLSGMADVAGGVATSPDLLARAPFMDVTGNGSIDLVEQALDYDLEAELTAPIGIPRCESMDGLVGESIPLTLGGTLDAPRIRPDFGEILKRRVQDAVRDRATERLEDRVRERLRDLF